jgi:hypothetical protein
MKIKETIEKNLITIIGAIFITLPIILEELVKYIPAEYSSGFGLLVLIIGKVYQVNNFNTVKNNEEPLEEPRNQGTIPLSPEYELTDDELPDETETNREIVDEEV